MVKLFGSRTAPDGSLAAANFERWFGESAVVDETGAPLMVFHGTGADFGVFDGAQDGCFFFSPCAATASWFADNADKGWWDTYTPVVMPVFLRIKNPRVITSEQLNALIGDDSDEGIDWTSMWNVVEAALKAGHDGIRLVGVKETNGLVADQWLAFEPEQIKAAYGNSGLFDGCSDDISDAYVSTAPERERMRA